MAVDIKFIDIPYVLSPNSEIIEQISYIGNLYFILFY